MTAYNTQNEEHRGGLFTSLSFMIDGKIKQINTLKICQVTAANADGTVNVKQMVLDLNGNNEPLKSNEWKNFSILQTQGGNGAFVVSYQPGDIVLVGFCDRDPQAVKRTRKEAAPGTQLTFPLSSGIVLGAVYFNAPSVYVKATDKVYVVGNLDVSENANVEGNVTIKGNCGITGNNTVQGNNVVTGNNEATTYSVGGTPGATLTFTDLGGTTHSVVNGIIVS